jgi:acyl carrier protein
MSDTELTVDIDWKAVDEITEVVRETARTICAEQPDVPEPQELRDLDSFSMVQVLLELENSLNMKLLEQMETFDGETFRDLGEFIVRIIYRAALEGEAASQGASPDQPATA